MDWQDWGRSLFALVATLALIGLAALAARHFALGRPMGRGRVRRMDVVERLLIDPRRQLVLVRLDAEEHLILLSPAGDRRIATRPALDPGAGDGAPLAEGGA